MKRIGIYSFYDKDGIVDDYVLYFLRDLRENLEELIVVSNGPLREKGKICLEQISARLVIRENKGFDIWGYKTGMDLIGWEKLEKYDEVVVCNNTVFGPVYPFSGMFSEMEKRELDFWGITKHFKSTGDPFCCNPYGYLPEHVQSYFMVYRRRMVQSAEFQEYWDRLPELSSYEEAVGLHETAFTKKFSDMGFSWDVYVQVDDMEDYGLFPLMLYPKKLVAERHCPVFKRRSFFYDEDDFLDNTTGQQTLELYDHICSHTDYDVNLVWDNLLRTCNQADIVRNLNLVYVASSKAVDQRYSPDIVKKRKIILVMHLYFMDLLDDSYRLASMMPPESDICITTNTEDKKREIEKAFAALKCHGLKVRVIENRGRDVSSILVGVKDIIRDYDYACFVHDKKGTDLKPASIGASFGFKCFSNILYNKEFVYNVLTLFEENPRMGILSPPGPNHSVYFPTFGNEWGPNFELCREWAEKLGIKVPMDEKKGPVCPLGTMFWFRPAAFQVLYDHDWTYEEFPKEPNKVDGTVLHAMERLYSLAVQQAGFYPAILMSD